MIVIILEIWVSSLFFSRPYRWVTEKLVPAHRHTEPPESIQAPDSGVTEPGYNRAADGSGSLPRRQAEHLWLTHTIFSEGRVSLPHNSHKHLRSCFPCVTLFLCTQPQPYPQWQAAVTTRGRKEAPVARHSCPPAPPQSLRFQNLPPLVVMGGGSWGVLAGMHLVSGPLLSCFVLSAPNTAPNRCSDFALLMMYTHKWCARRCRYVHICNHKALFQMTFNFTFIKSWPLQEKPQGCEKGQLGATSPGCPPRQEGSETSGVSNATNAEAATCLPCHTSHDSLDLSPRRQDVHCLRRAHTPSPKHRCRLTGSECPQVYRWGVISYSSAHNKNLR